MSLTKEKTRIFISHASNGDNASSIALDTLCNELTSQGYEVLVDKGFSSGPWYGQLLDYILTCDMAIQLVGTRALEASPWVSAEGFGLRVRERWDKSLQVFTVVLEGVDVCGIEASSLLKPAQLTADTIYQWQDLKTKVYPELKRVEKPHNYGDLLKHFVRRLRELLPLNEQGAFSSTCIKEILTELKEREQELAGLSSPGPILREVLFHKVIRSPLPDALSILVKLMVDLPIQKKAFWTVAPLWLPEEGALSMRNALETQSHRRLISGQPYESATFFTSTWYCARGMGFPLEFDDKCQKATPRQTILVHAPMTSGDIRKVIGAVKEQLCAHLKTTDKKLASALKNRPPQGLPIIAVVPSQLDEKDNQSLLKSMKEELPGVVTLLVLNHSCGGSPAADSAEAPGLELDIKQEAAAIECFCEQFSDEPWIPEFVRPYELQL